MLTKIHALSGSTAILAGALIIAAPCAAQTQAPEEFATRSLNAQASTEAAAAARVDAAEANDRKREYQKELQQHDQAVESHQAVVGAQQQEYNRELDAYTAEKQRYERDTKVYEEVLANLDDKRFAILTYPDQRLSELSRLSTDEVEGARVQDRNGDIVGHVEKLDIPRVMVRLQGGQTVLVRSPRLRYDLDTRVVITDVNLSDLEKMPRAGS